MAHRDGLRFDGQQSLSGHCGRGGTCQPARLSRVMAATAKAHGLTLVTRDVADIAVVGVSLLDPFSVA
jgi:hypothetical protein